MSLIKGSVLYSLSAITALWESLIILTLPTHPLLSRYIVALTQGHGLWLQEGGKFFIRRRGGSDFLSREGESVCAAGGGMSTKDRS